MKIVLPISGFSITPWQVYCWLDNYEKYYSNLDPVLFYDSASYEILSYWPFEKMESSDLLQMINYRKEDDFLFSETRIEFLKLLSFNYFGKCLVSDIHCLARKQLKESVIPVCDWGVCTKTHKLTNKDSEWNNLIYTSFDEFSFVQEILSGTMILGKDYSSDFVELYKQYRHKFYSMEYYPNFHKALISLCHKKNKGTFISSDWCKDYTKENNDTIFSYHYTDESLNTLLEKKLFQPEILI